jgi:hypothetical protein
MSEIYLEKIAYWARVIGVIVVLGFIAGLWLGISAIQGTATPRACQSQGGTVQGC